VTPIRIGSTDRVFIAGVNGSGKSVLATAIANRWPRVLVYDPKVDDEAVLPNSAIAYGVDAALRALPGRVIYRPTPAESQKIGQNFDRLAARLRALGGHGVVIHEVADLAASDRELEPNTAWVQRAGRSRGIPVIAVTQRPVNVPRLFMSEARHLMMFTLLDRDDRAVLGRLMDPRIVVDEPLAPGAGRLPFQLFTRWIPEFLGNLPITLGGQRGVRRRSTRSATATCSSST
jgi:hypothetical protein